MAAKQTGKPTKIYLNSRLWGCAAFLLGSLLVWSILSPLDSTSVFDGAAIPQNLFWLVLAVLSSVAAVVSGIRYRFSTIELATTAGCLLWLILVSILAGRENNPRVAWNGFWQVVALGSCYFSARALTVGHRSRTAVVQILLAGCIAVSLHGLYQVFIEIPLERERYLANPDAVIAEIPGLDAPAGSASRRRFEDRLLHSFEPYGTYALANSLAVFLTAGLVLWLGQFFETLRRREFSMFRGHTLNVLCVCIAMASMLLCWLLTRSRVAYLALLIGMAYWLLANATILRNNWKWMRSIAVLGGVVISAGLVGLVWNDHLVLSEAPKSLAYRIEYWLATISMLKEHWLFGIGLGNFQGYYPRFKIPTASETIADPHNWILDIFVNLSVPIGIVLLVWISRKLCFTPWSAVAPEQTHAPELIALDTVSGRYLLWGAAIGGSLSAALLAILSGQSIATTALTWLPGALLMAVAQPLRMQELCSPATARAAGFAMLTCLLISGSWHASGIAVPLLLMLVLASADLPAQSNRRNPAGYARWSICVLPTLGLAAFLIQCWRPATSSWSMLQQVDTANSTQQQLDLVQSAEAADPLDTEPLRWRAQIQTSLALLANRDSFPTLSTAATDSFDRWLARDSVRSLNWEMAGKNALELAAKAESLGIDAEGLKKNCLRYYTEAVARYPSNVGLRAQLATVLAINLDWQAARKEWELAIEASEQTPHLDKKLESQQLWLPLLPSGAEAAFVEQQPWIEAEPMLDWLRNNSLD